jgi:hypothetical protein
MKELLVSIVMLTISTVVWAQGASPERCDCEQTLFTTDATCSNYWDGCLSPSARCQSTQFVATCTGHYALSVSISCSSGSCSNYNVCAMLYDSQGNQLGHCFDIGDQCTPCYAASNTACVFQGQTYTLYVCLEACGDNLCPTPTTCTATGVVKYCGPANTACR